MLFHFDIIPAHSAARADVARHAFAFITPAESMSAVVIFSLLPFRRLVESPHVIYFQFH